MNKTIDYFKIDISNNKYFFNYNDRIFINRKICSLQDSSNTSVFNRSKFNNISNLNINNEYFNMKIKALLDKLQKERERINNDYLLKLEDKSTTYSKPSLDNYLQTVGNKYEYLFSSFEKPIPNVEPKVTPKLTDKIYDPFTQTHQICPEIKPKIELINIKVNITNIDDILELIEKYPLKWNVQYNINMEAIHNIKKPLKKLNNMIGMEKLKLSIIDQILYFIQNLHKNESKQNIDFMHTVIYGPPGTGKTEIANIIGDIFSNLGILKNKIFKKVTRSELIAGYLGQTAIKTKEVIIKCLGGCLFIDEAYSLGNSEKRDSFAKECIDTLCEALSFYKNDLMVIIAGYEKELKDCFFSYNSGLESRFTWRFNTDNYNVSELNKIFHKKVLDI